MPAAETLTEGRFRGAGGVETFYRAWSPEREARATVVLAHGVSEHSGRYAHVAAALNERGYAVWALDHRGHGRSGGSRALIDRLDNALADLDALVDLASRAGSAKPFLLGHSMGGMLATAYTIRRQERLAGLVLSGPVAVVAAASPPTRAISRVLSRVAPTLGVYQVEADGVSRDPEVVRAYVEHPLVYTGRLPVRTVAEVTAEVETFASAARAISIPILILHGGADPIVPVAGSELLAATVSSKDKELVVYDDLFHEILNEPEREAVIGAISDWLDARS